MRNLRHLSYSGELNSAARIPATTTPRMTSCAPGRNPSASALRLPASHPKISIVAQQNLVTVTGRKPENGKHEYLFQGISARAFERRFNLADHIEVAGASYENGLLQLELVRRVPEAMKLRKVDIGNVATLPKRDKAKRPEAEQAA